MSIPEPGAAAPRFSLADQHGKKHKLVGFRGKFLVLYFYPKDDTPGCTKEACQFRDMSREFAKRNAAVVGVSGDNVASHAKFAEKFSLPFPLLADEEHALCEELGVWQEKKNFGKTYWGIVRTTFIIDPAGKIAKVFKRVKAEGHDQQVLKWLDENAG